MHSLLPSDVKEIDFIPQAIFSLPIDVFARGENQIHTEEDDLDVFSSTYFYLDSKIMVALKHYRGFPPGTSSLYTPMTEMSPAVVDKAIQEIMQAFEIEQRHVVWLRTFETQSMGMAD